MNRDTRTVVVVTPHRSKFSDPIRFRRGDRVTVGEVDMEYDGWIWTTTGSGASGWAPRELLVVAETAANALADYDATELTTARGERLRVDRELAGWLWVSNDRGAAGWVPAKSVVDADDRRDGAAS